MKSLELKEIIVPKIVASWVQINALISLIDVLIGGASGNSRKFLSIPVTAILKVILHPH